MLSSPQIVARLEEIIAHIYSRPEMYGLTVGEINVALWSYHIFWATVQEMESEFHDAIESVEGNTTSSFTDVFERQNPGASEDAVVAHLLTQWRIVSERLGIDLAPASDTKP